eukprot:m.179197 g.179197  ORF g.179197 m.179197 type:complete len:60 (+) comp39208_c0_seq24:1096-1275(+)
MLQTVLRIRAQNFSILLNTTVVSIKSIHDSTDNSKFVQVTTKDSVTGEMVGKRAVYVKD